MTRVNPADHIWFHPPKFWAATKGMPQEQVDRLLNEVILKAEMRDLDALREFSFVSVGPHQRRPVGERSRDQDS